MLYVRLSSLTGQPRKADVQRCAHGAQKLSILTLATARRSLWQSSFQPHDERDRMAHEIGALPYRIRNKQLEIVLITTRRRKYWIFPKGQTEKQMTASKVAKLEAFEEAGVIGRIKKGNDRQFTVRRGSRKVKMKVFTMEFDKVLRNWPESDERKRVVLRFEDALKMIKGKDLRRCVKRMMRDVA